MRISFFLVRMGLLFLICTLSNPLFSQYCAAVSANPCGNSSQIGRFTLSNIDNNNQICDKDNLASSGGVDDGYSDYTEDTVYIAPQTPFQVSVEVLNGLFTDFVSVWIDWNLDNTWTEDELTPLIGQSNANIYTAVVIAPAGAVMDSVGHIRVVGDFLLQPTDACAGPTYGEIEDYSFLVTDATPPASTPSASYCTCTTQYTCTNGTIASFEMANVLNDNQKCDKDDLNSTGTGVDDGYSDYTNDFLVQLNPTTPYTVTVSILQSLILDVVAMWVDWDANGTWSQTEYYPLVGESTGTNTFTVAIVPPPGAPTGKLSRIRVIGGFTELPTNPCASDIYGYGEIEDYSFILLSSGQSVPACVDTSKVFPKTGSTNQCTHQTLRWPKVTGATYKLTLRDTVTGAYLANNLALTDTFYVVPTALSTGSVYSWIALSTVNGIDGYSCDSAYFKVSPNPDPIANIVPSSDTVNVCRFGSLPLNGNPSLGTPAYTHTWTNDLYNDLSSTTTAAPVFSSDSVGYYKLFYTVTDNNNCRNTDSVTVKVMALPKKGNITADAPFYCIGSPATLTLANYSGTVTWQDSSASHNWMSSLGTSTNDSTWVTAPLTENIFFRAVLFNGNCYDTTTVKMLDTKVLPAAPTVSIMGNDSLCPGETTLLSVTNYSTGIRWNDALSTNSPQLTVSAAGNYMATYTDANGCKSLTSAVIANNIAETKPVITASAPSPLCAGDSVLLTATGTNLQWVSNVTAPAAAPQYIATVSGKYAVTSTNVNGCSSLSDSLTLNFNPAPTKPSISNQTVGVLCEGKPIHLLSTGTGISWNTSATGNSIYPSTSGTYIATATGANGCKSSSDPLVLVFNPLPVKPVLTSDAGTPLCMGDIVNLSSTGNPIVWNTGVSTSNITATSTGDYFSYAESLEGCRNYSDTISLIFNPKPPKPSLVLGSNQFVASSSGAIQYKWINASNLVTATTGGTYTPIQGGLYRVVAVNAAGCESDSSDAVNFSGSGIEETSAHSIIEVYPNPSNGILKVNLVQNTSKEFKVYNSLGKLVWKSPLQPGINQLNLNLNNGSYFAEVDTYRLSLIILD